MDRSRAKSFTNFSTKVVIVNFLYKLSGSITSHKESSPKMAKFLKAGKVGTYQHYATITIIGRAACSFFQVDL